MLAGLLATEVWQCASNGSSIFLSALLNPLQQVAKSIDKSHVYFTGVNMSGTNKAMELHLQMRQNTEDLVSFMKDLENWETDIKKKDEELRTGRVQEGQV